LRNQLLAWYQSTAPRLAQSDIEKTMALLQELDGLGIKLSADRSEAERSTAETRLGEIENWLGALGISID